jgi:hypothetical protein
VVLWPVLAWACLAAGCAGVPMPPPANAGFRTPTPYRHPGPKAGLGQRESVYLSNRVTLNDVGYQVGLAPTDPPRLFKYLSESGAPDLAAKLRQASIASENWEKTAEATQAAGGFLPVPAVFAPLKGLGTGLLSGAARQQALDRAPFEDAARQYNLRLLKALSLPQTEAWAAPRRGLPAPLDQVKPALAPNAELADWIWDRSFHSQEPAHNYLAELGPAPGTRPATPGQALCVGGQDIDRRSIEAYMRSQDSGPVADAYASGMATQTAGHWTTVGGLLALVGGVVALVYLREDPQSQALPVTAILGGLVAMPVGIVIADNGTGDSKRAILTFNLLIPNRLRLRLNLPPQPPADAAPGQDP